MKLIVFLALLVMTLVGSHIDAADAACEEITVTIPATVNDPMLGAWLVSQAEAAMAKGKTEPCLTFVPQAEASETLSYLGVSPFSLKTVQTMEIKQLRKIQVELKASRIMILEKISKDRKSFTAKVYNIDFSGGGDGNTKYLNLVKKTKINLNAEEVRDAKTPRFWRLFSFLTPNAISLGSNTTKFHFTPASEYDVTTEEVNNGAANILSSFSLNQVVHPDSLNPYDTFLAISPSLNLISIDQYSTIEKKADVTDASLPETKVLHAAAAGICGRFDLIGSIYTSVGTFFTSLGAGPCYYALRQENSLVESRFDYHGVFAYGYRGFVTQNVFITFNSESIYLGKKLYESDFAKAEGFTRYGVSIGWFFVDAEGRMARRLSMF